MSDIKPVKITETALRDGHQSLFATRMTTEQMLPVLERMDAVGYHSIEAWGGATFDACLRYLNEDPWERLRIIRSHVKNTKLQMLFRGQNMLGYRHYPDDVVESFVAKSIENGIDIIRIFDALNDPRNLETAITAAKKYGGHVQAAISYTTSPVHSTEFFAAYAAQLEQMGADSVCIKDMAGLLRPYEAYELVKSIKAAVTVPVQLHTHYTSGLASMTLLKAIEAGVDVVDTALSPFAFGTSQPPTESIVATLAGTERDTGITLDRFDGLTEYFASVRRDFADRGMLPDKVLSVDVNALVNQVPGGMLSNLVSQLKAQGKEDKLPLVLAEVPRVRAEAGYPPLVTPTSQIVGTQAVMNVLCGERYKMVTKEFRGLVRGEYGRTPAAIAPEFIKKIVGDEPLILSRPADLLEPELDKLRAEAAPWLEQDEDVLTYAMFGETAKKFFEYRKAKKYAIDAPHADSVKGIHTV